VKRTVLWLFLLTAVATRTLRLRAANELAAVPVSIDCAQVVFDRPHLWGYVNVSRRAPPPKSFCALVERKFGRPQVTRCWLMLDQMWDYRTDTYRFNYEINKDYYQNDPNKKRYGVPGYTTGLLYYNYIDSVSAHSDTVLLNIRRYEQEVLSGTIKLAKWKEVFKAAVRHYKQRCPNLQYIEVLNEPAARNQSNLGGMNRYYQFYRRAYEAVNELNAEFGYDLPLLVGGCSGFRTAEAIHLIHDFAHDPNPAKKLDFVSFHHYWVKDPAAVGTWETEIDAVLREASLPENVPIFVSEIGYALRWKSDPKKNLWQAVGMTAYQYFARHADDLRLFPWVQYHSPQQIALVQFDSQLRMTPYGAAVKMLRMHRRYEVAAHSTGLDQHGNGVGVLATRDDTGLTVQLWNLSAGDRQPAPVAVSIKNLPACLCSRPLQVRRYLIDSTHSNCLSEPNTRAGLEMIEATTHQPTHTLELQALLEPMSLCLWQVTCAN